MTEVDDRSIALPRQRVLNIMYGMLVGRWIFIALLAVGTLLVGAAGGAGRVLCYGANGHIAIEIALVQGDCCDHTDHANVNTSDGASTTVCQADCTDIILTGTGAFTSRPSTTKLRAATTPDWGAPVDNAIALVALPDCSSADACHSPPDRFADLASLRVVVLLI